MHKSLLKSIGPWGQLGLGLLVSPLIHLGAAQAQTQDTPALVAHGLSLHNHTNNGTPYNEHNLGWGLRLPVMPGLTAQAGRYRNSLSTAARPLWSRYVVADWLPVEGFLPRTRWGLFAGLVDGYPTMNRGSPTPVAGAIMRTSWRHIDLSLRASPSKDSQFVAALEIGFKL